VRADASARLDHENKLCCQLMPAGGMIAAHLRTMETSARPASRAAMTECTTNSSREGRAETACSLDRQLKFTSRILEGLAASWGDLAIHAFSRSAGAGKEMVFLELSRKCFFLGQL
jgi:hypothetical protein